MKCYCKNHIILFDNIRHVKKEKKMWKKKKKSNYHEFNLWRD